MTDDQFKALSKQLDALLSPLKLMAQVQLAQELYPQAEREKLIAEYRALELADQVAFAAMQQAHEQLSPPGLSYEERVKQIGKAETDKQMVLVNVAQERRKSTSGAFDAFRKEHRLIARLFDNGHRLGKGDFEE